MQTHLWCARCASIREVDMQLKKMRGRTTLAQLMSVCVKCHSTLHTQTTGLEAAEEALGKFAELKGAAKENSEEEGAEEAEAEEEKEESESE